MSCSAPKFPTRALSTQPRRRPQSPNGAPRLAGESSPAEVVSLHFGTLRLERVPDALHFRRPEHAPREQNQGCGIKGFISTSVIQGNLLFVWGGGFWETLSVVSQKWLFPTDSWQQLRSDCAEVVQSPACSLRCLYHRPRRDRAG